MALKMNIISFMDLSFTNIFFFAKTACTVLLLDTKCCKRTAENNRKNKETALEIVLTHCAESSKSRLYFMRTLTQFFRQMSLQTSNYQACMLNQFGDLLLLLHD